MVLVLRLHLQLAALAIWLLFLVRLRYSAHHLASADDKSRLTPADYSLVRSEPDEQLPAYSRRRTVLSHSQLRQTPTHAQVLSNLDDALPADELQHRVFEDLATLDGATFREAIHHVEVGRRTQIIARLHTHWRVTTC